MTAQAVTKVKKTLKSIEAFRARGGNYGTKRAMELIDRYNSQKAAVMGDGGWNSEWVAFCAEINAHPSHNGYDLFA